MKRSNVTLLFYTVIVLLLASCLLGIHPYYSSIKASTLSEKDQLTKLEQRSQKLSTQLDSLTSSLAAYGKSMNELEKRLSDLEEQNRTLQNFLVGYYMEKLKDPTYVTTYNHDYTFYIAAENLGLIGAPAIPELINRLDTNDDYERSLVLYALCLASQADNMKAVCGSDYFQANLDFDARNHPAKVKEALSWWEKYKSHF